MTPDLSKRFDDEADLLAVMSRRDSVSAVALKELIEKALIRAYQSGREDGLEEGARVAEIWTPPYWDQRNTESRKLCRDAIRSLKGPEWEGKEMNWFWHIFVGCSFPKKKDILKQLKTKCCCGREYMEIFGR